RGRGHLGERVPPGRARQHPPRHGRALPRARPGHQDAPLRAGAADRIPVMTLVVGTDLSEQSLEGLRAAFGIAQRRGDQEILLVNVLDDEATHDASDAARDKLVGAARARLEADGARLAAGTGITVRGEVAIGHAEESLSAYAETEDADLLVVTSTGE